MRNLSATLCLTIALLLGSVGVSASADFQKGTAAYNSGDYATALRIWKPLAKQGNAYAQYWLGWMYAMGEGVSYNNKTAVKWYRLAAKQGDTSAQSKFIRRNNNAFYLNIYGCLISIKLARERTENRFIKLSCCLC